MSRIDKYMPHKKAVWVVVAVMLTASVSGYFMGLRQTASVARAPEPAEEEFHEYASSWPFSNGVPQIAEYRKLPEVNYKANAEWTNALDKLKQPPKYSFTRGKVSGEDAAKALAERSTRRAFDGAPPVVPHPIDQMSSFSCMACHGEATQIKDRVASKMSHAFMQNCTQCHVPSGGTGLRAEAGLLQKLASNEFVGAPPPGKGQRAFAGAPPTIPHPTSMRSDCASCHGPQGSAALRTSHPWQQSCTQCHAPSAELDQWALHHQLFPGTEQMQ